MDLIEMTRNLGRAIQKEDFYLNYTQAKTDADADEALQNLIGEFNLKRIAINHEACKEDRDEDKLKTLNEEMRTLYSDIMSNEHMIAYNSAKEDFDHVMQRVLAIINQCA